MLELESFAVIDIIRRFEVGTPPEKVGVRKAEGGPAMHVRFVFFFSELQLWTTLPGRTIQMAVMVVVSRTRY